MLKQNKFEFGPRDTECYVYEFEGKSPQSSGEMVALEIQMRTSLEIGTLLIRIKISDSLKNS